MTRELSNRPRVLIFQPALAPYRLHIYNELANFCQLKIVFLRENLLNQKFDQSKLRAELTADHEYLTSGFTLCRRTVRFGIQKKIREFKPDVVITVEFSPVTLTVLLFRKLSPLRFSHVIWTDDNPESIVADTKSRHLIRTVVLPRVHGLIVVSSEAGAMYRECFNACCPIGVVPIIQPENIFIQKLEEAKKEEALIRSKFDFDGKSIVLFVGRLAQEKRIDRLIKAFASLHSKFTDILLVLVGEGPESKALASLVSQLGIGKNVIFAGRHEGRDLLAWYRIADIFCICSEFEPFGAVVNEALISGVPVICSQQVGAKELIESMINGEVVDVTQPSHLEASLYRWIARIKALPPRNLTNSRASLMPIQFNEAVSQYLKVIFEAKRFSQ